MEYVVFFVFAMVVVLALFIREWSYAKKREKLFYNKRINLFGGLPEKEYKTEYFSSVRSLYDKISPKDCIDDITWNDLSMDEVFKRLNYTFSSAGEEYLYYRLRTPLKETSGLEHEEEQINYFLDNESARRKFVVLLSKIGYTGKFSIHKYLEYIDQLKERSNFIHYVYNFLYFLSLILVVVNTEIGIICLLCSLCISMTQYFKLKKDVEPYLIGFAYVCKITEEARNLEKEDCPAFSEELKRLRLLTDEMNGLTRFSSFALSGTRATGSGSPLDVILDYLKMIHHFDIIRLNQMQRFIMTHKQQILEMLLIIGQIDMMLSIAYYRKSVEKYCVPVFIKGKKLHLEDGYHPLIVNPVKNSIFCNRSVLLTGSNASGKSTFLKTVAINALLAQTIHTVLGEKYEADFFDIYSSMALRDDLSEGESYYIVEIKAMKRIIDSAMSGKNVLCFVDEVLRGTNTVERIAASTCILKNLAKVNVLCFAATHDIELTDLLKSDFDNYHFEEVVSNQDIYFPYTLHSGKATSRNAIRLLEFIGYDDMIIKDADKMAQRFLETGVWQ